MVRKSTKSKSLSPVDIFCQYGNPPKKISNGDKSCHFNLTEKAIKEVFPAALLKMKQWRLVSSEKFMFACFHKMPNGILFFFFTLDFLKYHKPALKTIFFINMLDLPKPKVHVYTQQNFSIFQKNDFPRRRLGDVLKEFQFKSQYLDFVF